MQTETIFRQFDYENLTQRDHVEEKYTAEILDKDMVIIWVCEIGFAGSGYVAGHFWQWHVFLLPTMELLDC